MHTILYIYLPFRDMIKKMSVCKFSQCRKRKVKKNNHALQSSYHAIYIAGIQVQCVQYQDCGTQCTLLPAPPLQWNSDNSCSEIEGDEPYITDEPSETDELDEDEVPANTDSSQSCSER